MYSPNSIYFRHLPHITTSEYPLFLTWRLSFNLPVKIKAELRKLSLELEEQAPDLSTDYYKMQQYQIRQKQFRMFDEVITKIDTSVNLTQDNLATILKECMHYYNGLRYDLLTYCIMPNHVHAVILVKDGQNSLESITHNWKRYSGRQINAALNRQGTLWQAETYDHVIRNEKEQVHYMEYTLNNPLYAGLVKQWQEWQHSYIDNRFLG